MGRHFLASWLWSLGGWCRSSLARFVKAFWHDFHGSSNGLAEGLRRRNQAVRLEPVAKSSQNSALTAQGRVRNRSRPVIAWLRT
ncbi:hypothetical protein B0T26DRAFT_685728 [Lasiosphaeria miniovina]|uniref:Secreted protein n=1 Tax=Lasiosphaeria miniovina TaxID=1954250 RepID=A0AA40E9X8_9PEZI|nr:uncharacterized protein B0T26DRAFT_685728 [Lasiosphaeria miniovina]KAK0733789.1 hypothetical protein B0T26DRAFT_685728 [Lasiosphaeria miniovina]